MKVLRVLATVAAVGSALPVYVYSDEWNNNTPVAQVMKKYVEAGATHLVLAFHLMTPAWPNSVADTVKWIYDMPAAQRKAMIDELHSMGAEIILSTAGASAGTTWFDNFTPAEYARSACGIAQEWGLDGVDFDLEGLPGQFGGSPTGPWAKWCTDVVAECKKHFSGYVTAAPQSPYLIKSFAGPYGFDTYGYDKLLIQYYNQGGWFNENTKEGLFGDAEGSVKDLMKRYPNAPKNAFVVGKPMVEGEDGVGGPMTVDDLHAWGCEAFQNYGWKGGFMFWRGHFDRPGEMEKIRRIAQPCPGESNEPATTARPITTARPTTTPVTTARPTTTPVTTARPTTTPVTTARPTTTPVTTARPTTTPVTTARPTTTPITTARPTTRPGTTQPMRTTKPDSATTPKSATAGDEEYPTVCSAAPMSDIVKACMDNVKSEVHWTTNCRANCLTLGAGGCLNYMCVGGTETVEKLTSCVHRFYPYCQF